MICSSGEDDGMNVCVYIMAWSVVQSGVNSSCARMENVKMRSTFVQAQIQFVAAEMDYLAEFTPKCYLHTTILHKWGHHEGMPLNRVHFPCTMRL
jgi:hypothetical protein